MNTPLKSLAAQKAHGQGQSKSAKRRREANRDVVFSRNPGQSFKMSDGSRYTVAKDGSFRRVKAVA